MIIIIIMLIALIVTSEQFIQQLLKTADRYYQRCKKSVINSWFKLKHLRELWYKLRFETLYTSLEIALISFDNMNYQDMHERSCKLSMIKLIVQNNTIDVYLTYSEKKLRRKCSSYMYIKWVMTVKIQSQMMSTEILLRFSRIQPVEIIK